MGMYKLPTTCGNRRTITWPDIFLGKLISYCCWEHDGAYFTQDVKIIADWNMAMCVGDTQIGLFADAWGVLMFLGVLIFGAKYYKDAKSKVKR